MTWGTGPHGALGHMMWGTGTHFRTIMTWGTGPHDVGHWNTFQV